MSFAQRCHYLQHQQCQNKGVKPQISTNTKPASPFLPHSYYRPTSGWKPQGRRAEKGCARLSSCTRAWHGQPALPTGVGTGQRPPVPLTSPMREASSLPTQAWRTAKEVSCHLLKAQHNQCHSVAPGQIQNLGIVGKKRIMPAS